MTYLCKNKGFREILEPIRALEANRRVFIQLHCFQRAAFRKKTLQSKLRTKFTSDL